MRDNLPVVLIDIIAWFSIIFIIGFYSEKIATKIDNLSYEDKTVICPLSQRFTPTENNELLQFCLEVANPDGKILIPNKDFRSGEK